MTPLILGDCLDVLRAMPDASVDAVVTDPPYGLGFMGAAWDTTPDGRAFAAWAESWARECLRVLKPGGHMLAFGGTRMFHRLTCGVEDAGFDIRDCLSWLYGTGFSKSWNFKTMFPGEWCACNQSGKPVPYTHEHDMHGLREGLPHGSESTPTSEGADVLQAMQRREQGPGLGEARTQGLNGERSPERSRDGRAPERGEQSMLEGWELHRARERLSANPQPDAPKSEGERLRSGAYRGDGEDAGAASGAFGGSTPHQSREGGQPPGEPARLRESPGALDDGALRNGGCCTRCGKLSQHYQGVGTALKPAWEPIILARKPLIGTVAANVQAHGTGGINVDACRLTTEDKLEVHSRSAAAAMSKGIYGDSKFQGTFQTEGQKLGRWPANVALDEEAAAILDEQSGDKGGGFGRRGSSARPRDGYAGSDRDAQSTLSRLSLTGDVIGYGDAGGASRFYYTAKASSAERELEDGTRSTHPTVKPVDLMRWLVRLVTPPGGVVLDPFMGSGSTGAACAEEGLRFIGIEREPEYHAIAVKRLEAATRQGRLDL